MELEEQITKAIMELRTHGLAYGGTIGYHAGWCDDVADRLADAISLIKKLTEENERLIAKERNATEILNFKFAYDAGKADGVRKMHNEIKGRCIKGGIYPAFVAGIIDQIAKEMTEGTSDV